MFLLGNDLVFNENTLAMFKNCSWYKKRATAN